MIKKIEKKDDSEAFKTIGKKYLIEEKVLEKNFQEFLKNLILVLIF